MKALRVMAVTLLALVAGGALAQQDLSGTWAGKLVVAPGAELEIHFVLTRQGDGSYAAVVTSPNPDGIKNVPASGVSVSGDRLALTVDALSGSYEGVLRDGAIEGQWRQEGSELPLNLAPYSAPVLSQAAKDALAGQWVGKLTMPGGSLTIVSRFETDAAGEFVGFLDSPDQGAKDLPLADIALVDNQLRFTVPRVRGEYTATFSGDRMTGEWSQGLQKMPLEMERGEYAPPPAASLALSREAMTTLAGVWRGKLGPLTIVLRFETAEDGRPVAFLDSPDQGATGIPVSAATFADGKLVVTVAALAGAQYSGDVAGETITGQWTQAGMTNPLNLTRD